FRDMAARYGTGRTRDIWTESANSVRGLVTLLRPLRIEVHLEQVPCVSWTCRTDVAADLERELHVRRSVGLSGRWLNSSALKRQAGIDGAGGILTNGNAQVDPFRACVGIAT